MFRNLRSQSCVYGAQPLIIRVLVLTGALPGLLTAKSTRRPESGPCPLVFRKSHVVIGGAAVYHGAAVLVLCGARAVVRALQHFST